VEITSVAFRLFVQLICGISLIEVTYKLPWIL